MVLPEQGHLSIPQQQPCKHWLCCCWLQAPLLLLLSVCRQPRLLGHLAAAADPRPSLLGRPLLHRVRSGEEWKDTHSFKQSWR